MSASIARPIGLAWQASPATRARGVRVLYLIPVVWALNLLDLLFTFLATRTGYFLEANPLARQFGMSGQAFLKLGALVFCTAMLMAFRRRRCTEWGCYLLLTVYGLLAVIWLTQYGFLLSPSYLSFVMTNG